MERTVNPYSNLCDAGRLPVAYLLKHLRGDGQVCDCRLKPHFGARRLDEIVGRRVVGMDMTIGSIPSRGSHCC